MADAANRAYIVTISKPHAYARSFAVNAPDVDGAWAIARAAVTGTEWDVVRVVRQPEPLDANPAES